MGVSKVSVIYIYRCLGHSWRVEGILWQVWNGRKKKSGIKIQLRTYLVSKKKKKIANLFALVMA